mgnify:CR=1 FL=1
MAHTLTYAATTITLPDDLLWEDEFTWQSVEQRSQYSITGALLVESSVKQAGRSITLRGGMDFAWIDRATLLALQAAAAQPVVRSEAPRNVVFDLERGAIEASPVIDYSDPSADDSYVVTLRYIEVG